MSVPRLSVIVPTYNRRASLLRTLEALARQTLPAERFEVLVVSDGATDGSVEAARGLQTPYALRVLEQANSGPSVARNRGAEAACGAVLVYIDDDIEPAPDLVQLHAAEHDSDYRLVLIGPQSPPPGERFSVWVEWEHRMLERQYVRFRSGEWEVGPNNLYSGNFSVRREHLLAVGGFDPTFKRQEDVELGFRLATHGLRFAFCAEAIGWHRPTRSFASWYQTPYLYGIRDVQMARDKSRGDVEALTRKHYRARSLPTRVLARMCIGVPLMERIAVSGLGGAVVGLGAANLMNAAMPVCSLAFNLRYLQGAAHELGGRRALFDLLRDTPGTPGA